MTPLAYKIATLLYCFDNEGRTLLMRRKFKPNLGLWSPCGGKLHMADGESPHACAQREAREEMGLEVPVSGLHLTGMVSEYAYEGQGHWLLFLFEVLPRLAALPPPHREGDFAFFTRGELEGLSIPVTDREQIWPLFWQHRGGFFAAHCRCLENGGHQWTVEESHHGRAGH